MAIKKHKLKTWPDFFEQVECGNKTFEVRKNDRDFKLNDLLQLQEWNDRIQDYTGFECLCKITYILEGGQFGIEEGYVVMGIELIY